MQRLNTLGCVFAVLLDDVFDAALHHVARISVHNVKQRDGVAIVMHRTEIAVVCVIAVRRRAEAEGGYRIRTARVEIKNIAVAGVVELKELTDIP